MKDLILFIFILIPFLSDAQAPVAGQLIQLHNVTTAEMNSVVSPAEGSLIYDTDTEALYTYTSSSGWALIQSEPNTYTGSFIISTAGPQSITELPFKPSQIIFSARANIETNNIDDNNGLGGNTTTLQNTFGSMKGFARDDSGTADQLVIFSGGSGSSINDISRYASSTHCIGIRYADVNGADLGKILASMSSFDEKGFTINVTHTNGIQTSPSTNPILNVDPAEVQNESLVVTYTAYR